MAIRDHLNSDVKKKLGPRKVEPGGDVRGKKGQSSLSAAFWAARLAAMILALMLADQTFDLGLLDWLWFGENTTDAERDMILTASLYDWVDDIFLVIGTVVVAGALGGFILGKIRGGRTDTLAALMQEAAKDVPQSDAHDASSTPDP